MAIFAIQQAVANEMAFGTTKENLQQRLNDLRRFLKVATEGGSIEFARSTLAKSLLVFMKVSEVVYDCSLSVTISRIIIPGMRKFDFVRSKSNEMLSG